MENIICDTLLYIQEHIVGAQCLKLKVWSQRG